jgi:hypothetical protein
MLPAGTIKKSIAALLLLVFTISIAPKVFFHAALAGHTDLPACTDGASGAHLHEERPNCHFDDLVVSSPFARVITSLEVAGYFCFAQYLDRFTFNYLPSIQLQRESRGPPLG